MSTTSVDFEAIKLTWFIMLIICFSLEIETQMTPLKATSVVSTGNTTSAIGEKDEVFMSGKIKLISE